MHAQTRMGYASQNRCVLGTEVIRITPAACKHPSGDQEGSGRKPPSGHAPVRDVRDSLIVLQKVGRNSLCVLVDLKPSSNALLATNRY